MPIETVLRRWTIATWMLAGADDQVDTIVAALGDVAADAIALQSAAEDDVEQIAAALGCNRSWARSHHPRSRLIPGSAVGLAVLTPHRIIASADHIVGDHRSLWSPKRRIAQIATVERDDHSAYTINHAVEHLDDLEVPSGAAPSVLIRPVQVGIDDERALQLPSGASGVSSTVVRPIDGAAPLLAVTFEMPWVTGDFPVG